MKEVKKYNPVVITRENLIVNNDVHQYIMNENLKDIKKDIGMFFTPEWVINFMIDLISTEKFIDSNHIMVLEPACGLTQFLSGIKRKKPDLFNKASLFGVEINQDIINYLTNTCLVDNIKLYNDDYLLWNTKSSFDLIIGNPPYGIPSHSNHYTIKTSPETKKKYKAIYETWYGKYNVYGAFIEKSIKLLKNEGQLIFIVPATFMILDEFKKLREYLSNNGKTSIIYLGSDVFKPEANVSSVVLNFIKSDKYKHTLELLEYTDKEIKTLNMNSNWKGEVVRFETNYSTTLENICPYRLGDIYQIRISPRTPEIKNNPLIVNNDNIDKNNYLPILNGKNLKLNKIIYDNLTGYWISKQNVSKFRGYFENPHIVVGLGFRENGKIAAGLDIKCYPWMGDIYHLLKDNNLFNLNFDLDEYEVINFLRSEYMHKYIKDVYREITYHLSITQLANLPLPDKKAWTVLKKEKFYE